jgi:hypothetical protein
MDHQTFKGRAKRPRITTPCVADRYHGLGERIVEFSFPDGSGGLISLRSVEVNGATVNLVELYRLDASVLVRLPTEKAA